MVKVVCFTSLRISTLTIVASPALWFLCEVTHKKGHGSPFFEPRESLPGPHETAREDKGGKY